MEKGVVRKSIKASFYDGIFYSIMLGFGDTFINPYAIKLGATTGQVGLLSSIPGLFSSVAQLYSPWVTEKLGRYRTIIITVFFHAIMWIPIFLSSYLFPGSSVVYFVIAFVTLYSFFGSFAGPAWASLMTQYLPPNKRGYFFGLRNQIFGFTTIFASFVAGVILYFFNQKNYALYGFTLIFLIAFVSRVFSLYFLTRYYEPKIKFSKKDSFTFFEFIKRIKESNFVKFVLYVGANSFAVNLASPFFAVYMLRELNFNYITYIVINTTAVVATLVCLRTWGKHSDLFGNLKIISFTSLIIPFLPILWIFSSAKIYLIVIQIIAGFAWAGFNLSVMNFIYDAVSAPLRVRCISYFNFINGIGLCFGAILGGYIIPYLPELFGSKIFSVFIISGLLRMIFRLIFIPKIREVRKVEIVNYRNLFLSVIGIKPFHSR